MGYFSSRDRALVEELSYDPAATPSFEILKACLVWPDESPRNITPEGYQRLRDLWIARSALHRGIPIREDATLNPNYFAAAWEQALREQIRWPGFERLTLSAEDKAYYEAALLDLANSTEI